MKGIIVSFRRGLKTYTPRQYIIKVEGITNKKAAEKLVNKKVSWQTPTGKQINGIITFVHGNSGRVRAHFEKGLPGQAIATKVDIS